VIGLRDGTISTTDWIRFKLGYEFVRDEIANAARELKSGTPAMTTMW